MEELAFGSDRNDSGNEFAVDGWLEANGAWPEGHCTDSERHGTQFQFQVDRLDDWWGGARTSERTSEDTQGRTDFHDQALNHQGNCRRFRGFAERSSRSTHRFIRTGGCRA